MSIRLIRFKCLSLALILIAITFDIAFGANDNSIPFEGQIPQINSLIREDGSMVKRLEHSKSSSTAFRRTPSPVVYEDWQNCIHWYEYVYRFIFGRPAQEIEMENKFKQEMKKKQYNQFRKFLLKDTYVVGNVQNIDYTIDIYVGSESKKLSVKLDTASDWLVIASQENNETTGDKFDKTTSSTFNQLSSEAFTIDYGSGYVLGYDAQDSIYIDTDSTIGLDSMEFLLAIDSNILDPDSGIMGFSRDYNKNDSSYIQGQVFIQKLKDANTIDSTMFSLFLGFDGQSSFIEFGSYNLVSYSNNPSQYIELTLNESFYWQTDVQGFSVGNYENNSYANSQLFPAIISTATPVILTPNFIGPMIINHILNGRYAWQSNGYYFTNECGYKKLDTFYILIQNYWLTVPPSSYMIEYEDEVGTFCLVGFAVNSEDYWVLGDSFLTNYYTVFDDDASSLILAPKLNANFTNIDIGEIPTRFFTAWDNPSVHGPIFTIFGIIMLGGAAFAILVKTGLMQKFLDKDTNKERITPGVDTSTAQRARGNYKNRQDIIRDLLQESNTDIVILQQ